MSIYSPPGRQDLAPAIKIRFKDVHQHQGTHGGRAAAISAEEATDKVLTPLDEGGINQAAVAGVAKGEV